MNGYEQIIKLMREQGKKSNPSTPHIGVMKSKTKCSDGELILEQDDLLVADHLKGELQEGDIVLLQRLNDEQYVIIERLVEL